MKSTQRHDSARRGQRIGVRFHTAVPAVVTLNRAKSEVLQASYLGGVGNLGPTDRGRYRANRRGKSQAAIATDSSPAASKVRKRTRPITKQAVTLFLKMRLTDRVNCAFTVKIIRFACREGAPTAMRLG